MKGLGRWTGRFEFWQAIPVTSYVMFLVGVFFMFLPVGVLGDITSFGSNPPSRLLAQMLFSGGIAVAYVVAARRPRWIPALVIAHLFITWRFDRLVDSQTTPLAGQALKTRLQTDTSVVVFALSVSFILLSHFVRREGLRLVRAHTEIALARDIHRLLVPPIARRIGGFEFRGISVPSGEVGGDLIDVVETNGGWIGYVADVSGHGVGAGLLMGMVKSAARTQLRAAEPIDRLLNTLNLVLIDLKKPEMFVTFAGLQFDGAAELQFSVAGHLPILHYRSEEAAIHELSVAQIPLAMFGDRSFVASRMTAPARAGDLFVILTDGFTEVFDGADREFGLDRIKSLIRDNGSAPLDQLEAALLSAVRAHGRQHDDQTLLLIRAAAPSKARSL